MPEKFLSSKQRYKPVTLPQEFSDEEMARDWTLSTEDKTELDKYRRASRLFVSIQLCAMRLYGRFLVEVNELSPRIVNYLNTQLALPPSLSIAIPKREATFSEQRKNILSYLGFQKYNESTQEKLGLWLKEQASEGRLPNELFLRAEQYLLSAKITLPGVSVVERLIISVCAETHESLYKLLYSKLSTQVISSIDDLLKIQTGNQHSIFYQLKEYPPSATINSLKSYLKRYNALDQANLNDIETNFLDPSFMDYLYKLTRRYSAKDIKRFNKEKRYSLMTCFLLESRKVLLDHLVKMHDQFIMDMLRKSRHIHESKHRKFRKRQKRAVDTLLDSTHLIMDWPDDKPFTKSNFWKNVDENKLKESVKDLHIFKRMEERGYGDILRLRYPSLRKYFSEFIHLPFAVEASSESLLKAINIVKDLDQGKLKTVPEDAPTNFMPRELRRIYINKEGGIKRNVWELGLAIAMKDALRSGDLHLPLSKQHVFFWDLILDDTNWKNTRESSYQDLEQPYQSEVKSTLILQFHQSIGEALNRFKLDDFAKINNNKLKLRKYDKAEIPDNVIKLQKTIDSSMPSIRIEQLLMEVDKETNFTRHFMPVQQHQSRPKNYYQTLLAALISQATNLGVVSMSASVKGLSVDMLRHVLKFYIREETIKSASAEIVNQHSKLPFSSVHGSGTISSSDAQRFKVRD
jgi:hypothetical protein